MAKARRDAGEQPRSRERFDRYAERWLSEYGGRTRHGLGPTSRADYAYAVRTFAIPFFRGKAIGDVTPLDVRRYVEHLKEVPPVKPQSGRQRYSAASIRRFLTPVKAMLAEAYELGLTSCDASKVRVVVPGDRRAQAPKALTLDQLTTLLEHIPGEHRPLFVFIAQTGVRISEALGAQWRDIEHTPEGPVFRVQRQYYRGELREETKTRESARSVALMPSLARELTRHRSTLADSGDCAPVFPSLTGTHQDAHNLRRRVFRPAAEIAGVPWATPHTLRHTLATVLRDQGYDAAVIAKVLGHTDEAFTRRVYIHSRGVPRFDELDGAFEVALVV